MRKSEIKTGIIDNRSLEGQRVLTLYDLVEAVQEEVSVQEDNLVINVVLNSLNTGKVKLKSDSLTV